jgi:hypothetical protein
MESSVYCVAFSDGLIKVGHTRDVRRRTSAYRGQAGPFLVEVTSVWASAPVANGKAAEAALLRAISEIAECTHGREWFRGATFCDVVSVAEGHLGPGVTSRYDAEVIQTWSDVKLIHNPTGHRATLIEATVHGLWISVNHGAEEYCATVEPEDVRFAPRTLRMAVNDPRSRQPARGCALRGRWTNGLSRAAHRSRPRPRTQSEPGP